MREQGANGGEPIRGIQRLHSYRSSLIRQAQASGLSSDFDWWMFHKDEQHSGLIDQGQISSATVGMLAWRHVVSLAQTSTDGNDREIVLAVPAIVAGQAFCGTTTNSHGGALYRIELEAGVISGVFPVPFNGGGAWGSGIGSTPAIVNGVAYCTALDGTVFAVDAVGMTLIWTTDLRNRDLGKNQPAASTSPPVACWTSPLVVNGRVYVGVGLGEENGLGGAFGFVYCLDAANGNVQWLYCTNKQADADNEPNHLPPSVLTGLDGPPPPPFTAMPIDPPSKGASVWSSCVYHSDLDVIFVGTGNPESSGPLPNPPYSSGLLALDATTGSFWGFFQPDPNDSYRPDDGDVDIGASPTLVRRPDRTVVAIGSKNGSFFLLDPGTPSDKKLEVLSRRQLLPYRYDDPQQPLPTSIHLQITGATPGLASSAAPQYHHNMVCSSWAWVLRLTIRQRLSFVRSTGKH